ncbi:uncharacterized protein [Drosophila virilis]|uniref:uncharacterized protein n=1 Tax=Drosophila virilis TaxID=7244 RepID=UPI001396006D|nr:uncharacterized protein LOC116651032 [Drosophila virilis]
MDKVECFIEQSSAFTIQATTNDIEVQNLVGISDLNIFIYGKKSVMRFKGVRLDICKLNASNRPSLMAMLQMGIQRTDNNLPKECPLKRNTTYVLRHMRFDGNYLPVYLPEYNFTYIGKFHANHVNTFEVRLEGSICYATNDCTGAKGVAKTTEI